MKRAIFPIYYFPPISYFKAIVKYPSILFELHDNYQKQSYRNRCKIATANGVQILSIPVKKKNKIRLSNQKEVLKHTKWQEHHWKSLQIAYRRSPYFEFYEREFASLFKTRVSKLYEFNIFCLEKLFSILSIQLEWEFTQEYNETCSDNLDYRNSFSSKGKPGCEIPPYIQVFSDRSQFISDLSILDLIFCLGPESVNYL